jgi:pimeloyl-ACP methyl ester carboxylesterase
MNINVPVTSVAGREHYTEVRGQKLFLWEKPRTGTPAAGTILFVHGSSMASTPGFDLQAPGYVSAMDWFGAKGFDTWCCDHRGYGRSYKGPEILATIADGADDLDAASRYILARNGGDPLLVYGISSGALRAALFAECHPERVKRLALDAFVWTGKGSPTLEERRKKLPQWQSSTRRPISREFIHSIHTRDKVFTVNPALVEPYNEAVLALDDSVPNGTYIDMCANLPVNDPKNVKAPTGHARPIRRDRELRRSHRLLPAAAERRQGIRGASRYRARLVHADESPARLSRAVVLLHPAGAGAPGAGF